MPPPFPAEAPADRLDGSGVEQPIYDPYVMGHAADSGGAMQRSRRAGRRGWLLVIALSSLISTVATVGIVGWAAYHWRDWLVAQSDESDESDEADTRPTGHAAEVGDSQKPNTSKASESDSPPVASVPDDTRVERIGKLEVVDVGLSSRGLKEVLLTESSLAKAVGKRVVVMTTGRECRPCQGVAESLQDERVQKALAGVRLVRVDLRVFKEELAALKMSVDVYPAFFLLGDDMTPIDGIHGGEWDEDIAPNIAPVLGKFVAGQYRERRHDWSPTTGGVSM